MKRNYWIYAMLLLFSISCTDYLEETPDNRIEPNTLDKVAEMLVSAYPKADYLFTDWMTEDVQYISTNTQKPRMTEAYLWDELDKYDDNGTPGNYWNGAYAAISQANAALEALNQIDTDDVDYRNAIEGEALICRAYSHFMLVSLFAKNYDEASSANDPGVPYVTEPETVLLKEYKRASVKEVYNFIEKDLTDGMKLLSDDYYSGSKKYHFTTTAAKAFACRFYLYKGDYAESIKYANSILGENTVNTAYIKDFVSLDKEPGAAAKRTAYVHTSDASNILIVEKLVGIGLRYNYGYRTSVKYWNSFFGRKIWSGGDRRNLALGYYGDGNRNTIKAPKFNEEFYKESLTATTGYPFYVQPVFRGVELLFNRVESNIALGNYQLAMDDLNVLANLRYSSPNLKTIEQVQAAYGSLDSDGNNVPAGEEAALLRLMLSEKQKEFIQEGMRWFDIKRHDISVTHVTYDGREVTLEANDSRKVLQIPMNAVNRGIKKNSR